MVLTVIEERAKKNIERMSLGEYSQEECYKLGATDQYKVDIDNTCDYLLKRLRDFRDEIKNGYDTSITSEIIKFRSVMQNKYENN